MNQEVLEKLAELEHQQWEQWTKDLLHKFQAAEDATRESYSKIFLFEVISGLERKWGSNWKPYSELDESTKEFNREWARKVLEIVEKNQV
jgi:hypothetical protein